MKYACKSTDQCCEALDLLEAVVGDVELLEVDKRLESTDVREAVALCEGEE